MNPASPVRLPSFHWFVILVTGLMIRIDKLGITSIIRSLSLRENCYEPMIRFFCASFWSPDNIRNLWISAVKEYVPFIYEETFHVLVGDGMKQSKERRRMPEVKKLFQESENSAKPEYIHGHMFRGLGIL